MMTDTLSQDARSERRARIRGKDTKPEMIVRRLVHGMGYRYCLHDKWLPGSPDLVFRGRRKVIFVHGCFWHRHPDPACKRARDERDHERLVREGWGQMVVWECQCGQTKQLKNKIRAFLEGDGHDYARH